MLHSAFSYEFPSHGPLLHVLFRVLDPGPHVAEQSLYSPQSLQAENACLVLSTKKILLVFTPTLSKKYVNTIEIECFL